jgi:hypothetical protein
MNVLMYRPTPLLCSLLHEHFPVVPDLIREYIQQVQDDLRFITSSPGACGLVLERVGFG